MGKRILTVFEIAIAVILFTLFSAMVITTNTNDAIIENTEEFVELVRYKGCITDEMYSEFLQKFNVPVNVKINVTRHDTITGAETLQFTGDVLQAIHSTTNDPGNGIVANTYTMRVGDEIEVIVRKSAGGFYDSIVGILNHKGATEESPVIATKGGMILNTQYAGT